MRADDRERDALLVGQAQGGSEAAFRALAERWRCRLVAHAWRLLGDREEAGDAAQGAWVEIARGLERLRDPVAFPAWVYRITTRQAAAVIRRRRSDRRLAQALEQEAATESASLRPEADLSVDIAALHVAVQRLPLAVQRLPPAQRAALALHHFENLSVAEVAVALDVPAGTIKTRLMHARLKLRAALEGDTP